MSDSSDNSKPTLKQDLQPGAPYKKGDFIGQKYEVYGVLGKGGFGIVYLVYSHEVGEVFALKTFKDEFLADQDIRKRFHKEASVWVELGRHPYLVRASFVDEISGRLYIGMEYIAPNEEGLNSLEGYLRQEPPDLAQSLRWAIQICHGMEYAYSRGLRAHRDLKPANIMITRDKTAKITDFGLAGVLSESPEMRPSGLMAQQDRSGQTMLGTGFGTPPYMPPEQFDNAAGCDARSDIYSFGVMLYQMAAGGRLPFAIPMGADWQAMRRLHREFLVPRLDSPLFPIIQRCLEKSPEKRYQTFKDVRSNLEPLLRHQTGETVIPPKLKELESWEWNNKGASLHSLGRNEEAILCYTKALVIDSRDSEAWNNKGVSLHSLGRHEEAISCHDKALALDPRNGTASNNKGISLDSLGRHEEAIRCFDKALELSPRDASAWSNKGGSLDSLGRPEEAIHCYDKALALDPSNAIVWYNRGKSLNGMGRHEEAIHCYDKALELDPRSAAALTNKGISLKNLGRYEEAMRCSDRALEINPNSPDAWSNRGNMLDNVGRPEEAILCYDKALALDPSSAAVWYNKGDSLDGLSRPEEAILCYDKALALNSRLVAAWSNKGNSLGSLGRHEEAIRCLDKALALDPRHVHAWFSKALAEDKLSHWREAEYSFQQFLALAPARDAEQIEYARRRLGDLGDKSSNKVLPKDPEVASRLTPEPDPHNAATWYGKGLDLHGLDRYEDAIFCYDKALELDPRDVDVWYNKGNCLHSLEHHEEAICCFDKALAVDPRHVNAWCGKGNCLHSLGHHEEAICCFDKALAVDPRHVNAWCFKGLVLHRLARSEEAIHCYEKVLELDPGNLSTWFVKALAEDSLGQGREAAHSYLQFLALAPAQAVQQIEYARKRMQELEGKSLLKTSTQSPRVSPKRVPDADRCEAGVWFKKGNDLLAAGFFEESVLCFDKALELDPCNAQAWTSKGFSLESLGRHDEAIDCHNRALEVDRCNLDAWYNKARAEDGLGYLSDAAYCYQKFLAFHPSQQYAQQIEHARKRLQELAGK